MEWSGRAPCQQRMLAGSTEDKEHAMLSIGRCKSRSLAGGLAKRALWGLHECRQKCVRNGADACQPQLLHQPVLQRMMRPFHAALGLAGIGAQNLDVELRQGAPELGHAVTAGGIFPRYPKDRMLVRIECHRLAMALQITLQSLEIGKRALRWDKA